MAHTDTETQDTFCHYTDVKFSSALQENGTGVSKAMNSHSILNIIHNHRALRHLHLKLSPQSVTAAVHSQFQSGVKVYIYVTYTECFTTCGHYCRR
jgi:hypothetical protein